MTMGIDIEGLRRSAAKLQRVANSLPTCNPNRIALTRAACALDASADEIEALSPAMRADLDDFMASLRGD